MLPKQTQVLIRFAFPGGRIIRGYLAGGNGEWQQWGVRKDLLSLTVELMEELNQVVLKHMALHSDAEDFVEEHGVEEGNKLLDRIGEQHR